MVGQLIVGLVGLWQFNSSHVDVLLDVNRREALRRCEDGKGITWLVSHECENKKFTCVGNCRDLLTGISHVFALIYLQEFPFSLLSNRNFP